MTKTGSPGPARPRAARKSTRAGASTRASPGTAASTPKKGKYNAKGRHVGKVWCASEAEAVRYEQLLEMQDEGIISKLEPQPSFRLVVNGVKIGIYRADFRYMWHRPGCLDPWGEPIVEEVKGLETPEWKLKKKLFEALEREVVLKVITKPRNREEMARLHGPQFVEAMAGRMSSFAEWIRLRYRRQVPE